MAFVPKMGQVQPRFCTGFAATTLDTHCLNAQSDTGQHQQPVQYLIRPILPDLAATLRTHLDFFRWLEQVRNGARRVMWLGAECLVRQDFRQCSLDLSPIVAQRAGGHLSVARGLLNVDLPERNSDGRILFAMAASW